MAPRIDILAVDDTPRNLTVLRAVLAAGDVDVVTASAGPEALALARDRDFALIIVDVQMPGMDGYEVARQVRADPRARHTPIIFLTAFDPDPEQVRRAYASGAVDFVVKPFDVDVLRSKVAVFVDLFRKTRDLEEHARQLREAQEAAQAAAVAEARAAELRRIDRLKDEFLAMLAHELRNPLMPLLHAASLLERQAVEDATLRRLHDVMVRQLRHLQRLVDDSLEVSRFTQGKIEVRRAPLDLRDAVHHAIEMAQPVLDARQHRLEVALPEQPVPVHGDQARLAQVVSNLLNNAAKFTEPGGEVQVRVTVDGPQAVLRVRDTGRGIAPDMLGKIFEPFVQAQAGDAARGGLGIGLALVRQLVALHDGAVSAHSDGAGRGTEMSIQLPLLTGEAALAASTWDRASSGPRAASPVAGARILVVDDNADVRNTVRVFLELEGHTVMTADSGRAALDRIQQSDPDVVLLDLGLPDIDGYAVARQVRSSRGHGRPRLLAMTGDTRASERERALEAGFDGHVVKPIEARALARAVARSATSAAGA